MIGEIESDHGGQVKWGDLSDNRRSGNATTCGQMKGSKGEVYWMYTQDMLSRDCSCKNSELEKSGKLVANVVRFAHKGKFQVGNSSLFV
jgi:hypothetical protein